ncbi:FKBP-type peptidyl-prolyl cis-trans isomerase [Micromonospora radicis]|uniref:Peptidyl-prolyl cis-trans isomerase n=1 Tax=Micromonospora radicis TaxID=1894971 RepID=A0A418N0G8_9ACTN|nr:FKBP-type peptidyl-prolyl cis-trans isomerase [Micromonospora radicis]RIV41294.1 FKBP-type peptidyl-prolyl cis-trans isomerase [Micromonospora radicis]
MNQAASKPEIGPIEGAPPADLVIEDITVGEGPEAQTGQVARVHYVGVSHSTGNEFDASWNRGEAFEFPLGGGRVISGWDQGVVGMRVGGRRKLTIPPHLGYGSRGAGGVIKPNETLVFVVDLLGVR